MSEPSSTHESCLPHFRDECANRHVLFGCLSAAASALNNAFVLVQVSRFQQVIGVFTLQTPTEVAKVRQRSRDGNRVRGSVCIIISSRIISFHLI